MTSNLSSIQYLRALAAIFVVYFHTKVYLPDIPFELPRRFGFGGVDIFFAVSGFIIYAVTFNARDSIGEYFKKRFIRVIPLYWGATLAAVVLFAIAPGSFIKQSTSAMHVVMSLLFLPYPSPDGDGAAPFLKIGWTLIFEMYFYVVFGALLFIRNATTRLAVLAIYFFLSIAYGAIYGADGAMLGYYTNPIMLEFVFGAGVAALYTRGLLRQIGTWPATAIVMVASAVFLVSIDLGSAPFGRVVALGIPAVVLVAGMVAIEENGRLPAIPVLSALGDASYSIYLAHPFALTAMKLATRSIRPAEDGALTGFLIVTIYVCFAVGLGYAVHRLIEQPILDLLRGALLKRRLAVRQPESQRALT